MTFYCRMYGLQKQGSKLLQTKKQHVLRRQLASTITRSSSSLIISPSYADNNALGSQFHCRQCHKEGCQLERNSQRPSLTMQQRFYHNNLSLSSSSSVNSSYTLRQQEQEQGQILKVMFHSSRKLQKEEVNNSDNAAATKDDKDSGDECPSWENPLHHNNPEMKKVFVEDFDSNEKMEVQELPPFEDPNDPDKVLAPEHIHELANEIVHLSMLEMNELVNKIADHFGFEKPPFETSIQQGGGDAVDGDDDDDEEGEAAAAEEKTAFDIKLLSFDAKSKIKVIKEVRALAGLGLKEAKEMVESAPKAILKDIKKEQAEEIKKKLEEIGAAIEIV